MSWRAAFERPPTGSGSPPSSSTAAPAPLSGRNGSTGIWTIFSWCRTKSPTLSQPPSRREMTNEKDRPLHPLRRFTTSSPRPTMKRPTFFWTKPSPRHLISQRPIPPRRKPCSTMSCISGVTTRTLPSPKLWTPRGVRFRSTLKMPTGLPPSVRFCCGPGSLMTRVTISTRTAIESQFCQRVRSHGGLVRPVW